MYFREKQNTSASNQDTYTSAVVEKSSINEETNYTTLEQGLTMQYLTVGNNAENNQDYTDAASKQEGVYASKHYENVHSTTPSARDSQDTYGAINDDYETPQRSST